MTECGMPELPDLLPDYLAESLPGAKRARVVAHLAECAACRTDLAILRQVRAAAVSAPPLDLAGIVAALPRPSARPRQVEGQPVGHGPAERGTGRTAPAAAIRPSRWQAPHVWRMAATIGVVLAGGFSVVVARRGASSFAAAPNALQVSESTAAAAAMSGAAVQTAGAGGRESGRADSSRGRGLPDASADVAVSYGALDDATEQEWQALLDRLEKWDGATSAEPAPTVSVVTARGGGGVP